MVTWLTVCVRWNDVVAWLVMLMSPVSSGARIKCAEEQKRKCNEENFNRHMVLADVAVIQEVAMEPSTACPTPRALVPIAAAVPALCRLAACRRNNAGQEHLARAVGPPEASRGLQRKLVGLAAWTHSAFCNLLAIHAILLRRVPERADLTMACVRAGGALSLCGHLEAASCATRGRRETRFVAEPPHRAGRFRSAPFCAPHPLGTRSQHRCAWTVAARRTPALRG